MRSPKNDPIVQIRDIEVRENQVINAINGLKEELDRLAISKKLLLTKNFPMIFPVKGQKVFNEQN